MELTPVANEILLVSNFLVHLVPRLTNNNYHKSIIYLLFLSQTISFVIYDKDEINHYLALISFLNGLYLLYKVEIYTTIESSGGKIDSFFYYLGFEKNYHLPTIVFTASILIYDVYNGEISQISYFVILLCSIIMFHYYYRDNIKTYTMEIEFLFFFVFLLTLLFLSSSLIDIYSGNLPIISNLIDREITVEIFLSRPLVSLLNLFGIQSWYDGQIIFYPNKVAQIVSQVHITKDCSGLDSVVIFTSAFFSFVIVSENFSKRTVPLWLIFGLVLSYFANIIRMFLIILAGHYYGSETLFWVHKNVGWIIFVFWFYLFWIIFSKSYEEAISNER